MLPCNDRLAVMGLYALEALVGLQLRDKFCAQSGDDDFIDPAHVKGDLLFSQVLRLGAMDSSINDHCKQVACAVTCARLKLHKNLELADEDLAKQVDRFAYLVAQDFGVTDSNRDQWSCLVGQGVIRILGDLFLAVIGAILLDSNFATLREELYDIVETHMGPRKVCELFPSEEEIDNLIPEVDASVSGITPVDATSDQSIYCEECEMWFQPNLTTTRLARSTGRHCGRKSNR